MSNKSRCLGQGGGLGQFFFTDLFLGRREFNGRPVESPNIDNHDHHNHHDHDHDQEREAFILQSIVSCRSHRFIKQYKTTTIIINLIIHDGFDDEPTR